MSLPRSIRAFLHRAARRLPRRLRPRAFDPGRKVTQLTEEQRARLRENLRRLVHPKTA